MKQYPKKITLVESSNEMNPIFDMLTNEEWIIIMKKMQQKENERLRYSVVTFIMMKRTEIIKQIANIERNYPSYKMTESFYKGEEMIEKLFGLLYQLRIVERISQMYYMYYANQRSDYILKRDLQKIKMNFVKMEVNDIKQLSLYLGTEKYTCNLIGLDEEEDIDIGVSQVLEIPYLQQMKQKHGSKGEMMKVKQEVDEMRIQVQQHDFFIPL